MVQFVNIREFKTKVVMSKISEKDLSVNKGYPRMDAKFRRVLAGRRV